MNLFQVETRDVIVSRRNVHHAVHDLVFRIDAACIDILVTPFDQSPGVCRDMIILTSFFVKGLKMEAVCSLQHLQRSLKCFVFAVQSFNRRNFCHYVRATRQL